MPKTRHDVDRATKVEAILDAAEAQLTAGGYQAMSIAAIARELGLAQNAIHWYFRSKDDLLVAVLDRMVAREVAAAGRLAGKSADKQILWGADRLAELHTLCSVVHERSRVSPTVADFNRRFHDLLGQLFVAALEGQVGKARAELVSTTFIATAEGLLLQDLQKSARDKVLRFALKQLLADA
jgi:AcrR family transcriptional regulator